MEYGRSVTNVNMMFKHHLFLRGVAAQERLGRHQTNFVEGGAHFISQAIIMLGYTNLNMLLHVH